MRKKLKKGSTLKYSELKTQFYLTPEGGLSRKEMENVFSARTETLNIGAEKPYKFKTTNKCQAGCLEIEDIEHIVEHCKIVKIPDDEKHDHEVFNNVMNVKIKENVRKLMKIIEKRNMKILENEVKKGEG